MGVIVFREHDTVQNPDVREIRLPVCACPAYQIIPLTMRRIWQIRMQYVSPGCFHRNGNVQRNMHGVIRIRLRVGDNIDPYIFLCEVCFTDLTAIRFRIGRDNFWQFARPYLIKAAF